MEEEKSQPPEHQIEQAEIGAAAFESDEERAHRLYMQEIMAMEEWEVMRVMDLPSSSSSSSAGVGAKTTAPGKFWAGTPPYAQNDASFESVQEAESGAVLLGNSRIPGPLEALADERIGELRAATRPSASNGAGTNTTWRPGPCDFATTRARERRTRTFLSKDGSAGSSSSTQHDPVSTTIFAGFESEEGHDNSWYGSMVVPDDDEKPEQVEVQSLTESLQSCLVRSEEPSRNPAAEAEWHELSLQDAPSAVPGPSTRVPPLADHEVPTFHCGMCKDTLPILDVFHGLPCHHRFCTPCMTTYVQYRLRASELPVTCPDLACGGLLHPDKCKKAIDYETFGDWGAQLVESAIPPNRRAYCSNTQCGLMVETSCMVMAPCPECGHALVRKRGWRPIYHKNKTEELKFEENVDDRSSLQEMGTFAFRNSKLEVSEFIFSL